MCPTAIVYILADPARTPPLATPFPQCSEIPLPQLHAIDIHTLLEPAPFLPDLDVIPTHHPLLQFSILRESPVLDAVAALPYHGVGCVAVFVPKGGGS